MGTYTSIILLEFNELSPLLLRRFIQGRHLPNFERFRSQSAVYTTDAGEKAPNLEPWIQWATVHSSLSYAEHKLFRLDEGGHMPVPYLWELLSEAGLRTWICGSMNARYNQPGESYFLPDPWAARVSAYPAALHPYQAFIRRSVQEHTRGHGAVGTEDYLKFLAYMRSHGLSISTIRAIADQVLLERRTGLFRWKRASLMERLQWDLFSKVYKATRPRFSTLFLNSTAHYQHLYWRHMQPELFEVQPSLPELEQYGGAILYGFKEMDRLLGECMKLADKDANTVLMLCTALGQRPCLAYEANGGKHIYRPRSLGAMLEFAGVASAHEYAPVMAEQFYLRFPDETSADRAEKSLLELEVNGSPAMDIRRNGTELFAGCKIYTEVAHDSILTMKQGGQSASFYKLFYPIEGIKSGMHHPEGILWVRGATGKGRVHTAPVPLSAIAPTVLSMLDVPIPEYMTREPLL